jgi:hypothetical protein
MAGTLRGERADRAGGFTSTEVVYGVTHPEVTGGVCRHPGFCREAGVFDHPWLADGGLLLLVWWFRPG